MTYWLSPAHSAFLRQRDAQLATTATDAQKTHPRSGQAATGVHASVTLALVTHLTPENEQLLNAGGGRACWLRSV
jgi:hypothetical protein